MTTSGLRRAEGPLGQAVPPKEPDLRLRERDIILDSIADGVFTVDRDWRITSFNRAAETITGVPRQKAIGRPCSLIFRSSICETDCALRHTMETGEEGGSLSVGRALDAGCGYDAVFDFGVLHHLPEWRRAVREVWPGAVCGAYGLVCGTRAGW